MQGVTCVRCLERLPACFGMRLIDGHGVRRPERLPDCFSMRLVDGHGVRPLEFFRTPFLEQAATVEET